MTKELLLDTKMTNSPSRTRSRSVREQTYRLLRRQLVTGQFLPGQRLTEHFLAKRLEVSRTPIRESLHKLELEGLVIAAGARGYRVPDDLVEDMNELFEIRAILEGHALACLSTGITAAALDKLRLLVEQAEQACGGGDLMKVFALNTKFHDMLSDLIAESRPRLHGLIEDMRHYVLRYRKNTLIHLESAQRSIVGHKKILLAIELGDAQLCERIMRAHVGEAREDTPAPAVPAAN
jgi:DNA-binding GntR family transcriptional regulator